LLGRLPQQGFKTGETATIWAADVPFGSQVDIQAPPPNVCFTPESGYR
jgi:hypothetical protein